MRLVDLDLRLVQETERAVLVTNGGLDDAVWLPNSQCEYEPCDTGNLHTFTMPEWLAVERNLI